MAAPYLYEIYDTEENEWLHGQYRNIEVQRKLGVKGSISEFAKNGTLLRKRYKVVIAGEKPVQADTFQEEWDKARMKILDAR